MISINSFDDIVIDGESVGDCIAASANHPKQAAEILQALIAYDAVRQGDADVKSTEAAIAQAQKSTEPLQQKITELEGTIAHLTARLQQLAPNLAGILPALLESGLTAWCDRAVTTYNESHHDGADSLMPIVAKLYAAASNNQITAVPPLFGEIMQRSMVAPTSGEARAMQAILDGVQFPPELINFYPWIEQ